MSLVMFAIMGLTPLSYALAGAVAESGLTILFIGSGAGMILLSVATVLTSVWRTDAPAPMTATGALGQPA
jgi:hypothetical protein